jgi:hypothetical protein
MSCSALVVYQRTNLLLSAITAPQSFTGMRHNGASIIHRCAPHTIGSNRIAASAARLGVLLTPWGLDDVLTASAVCFLALGLVLPSVIASVSLRTCRRRPSLPEPYQPSPPWWRWSGSFSAPLSRYLHESQGLPPPYGQRTTIDDLHRPPNAEEPEGYDQRHHGVRPHRVGLDY